MQFRRLPALAPLYWRALRRRGADRSSAGRAQLVAEVAPLVADAGRLLRFRTVVAQADDGCLPPTFPQVLAAPLHLALFTSREFAFDPVGLVHLANRIEMRRNIRADERLSLRAELASFSDTPRGCEIVVQTDALDDDGELAWHSASTVLARSKHPAGRPRRRAAAASLAATEHVASWRAEADIGRRYARVSGDYNPIHLARTSARLFGFERPIAHGMWSLARVLAALHPWPPMPLTIDVTFRRPMLLPTQASLFAEPGRAGQFVLRDNKTSKPLLQGSVYTAKPCGET